MGYEFASECFCGAADEDYTVRGPSESCKDGLGGSFALDVYKVLEDPPVDGNWGSWGPCSETCGDNGTRTRLCDSPAAKFGGAECVGSATDSCDNDACPVERQEYVGCFADQPWKGRALSYFHEKRNIGLEACSAVCRARGSLLMGYEYDSECFCGDAKEHYSRYGVSGDCKDGNGGSFAIDIYKVLPDPLTAAPVTAPTLVKESLGCYADEPWNGRVFSYFHKVRKLTLEECAAVCVGRGDRFMGYQFQEECFCGSEDYTKYGEHEGCKNGKGAGFAMNVYRVEQ